MVPTMAMSSPALDATASARSASPRVQTATGADQRTTVYAPGSGGQPAGATTASVGHAAAVLTTPSSASAFSASVGQHT